jgi:glucans biosynthesis protein
MAMLAPAMARAFDFDDVAARAQADARAPYQAPHADVPAELRALTYDQVRDIRHRPPRALWRREGLPFEVMFFHLGGMHALPVAMNEIVGGQARPLRVPTDDFDYGKNTLHPERWQDLGVAGFRVHCALNTDAYKDELAVFLGSSYFRMVGAGQLYGLSARGLAIDTTGSDRGEEFPRFKAFWLERPAAHSRTLTIYALLDSPRVTGAYRFVLRPGRDSDVQVRARIFLRAPVAMLGIAPLTSMFHHGENTGSHDDFRPEVHDSDGLMVATGSDAGGGEWLWRPLVNPSRPIASSFAMPRLRGYGLMQRDRAATSYEDPETSYERRPSAWVVPEGDWGPGRVELLQLPTPDEMHDNIVAAWVPQRLPAPGEPLDVAYRIVWQGDTPQRPPNAWTVQTRSGRGAARLAPGEQQVVVDFAGPALQALPPDARVEAVVTPVANAQLVETNAYRHEAAGAWRMTVRFKRNDARQPTELRAFLRSGSHALTETWTSLIPPD